MFAMKQDVPEWSYFETTRHFYNQFNTGTFSIGMVLGTLTNEATNSTGLITRIFARTFLSIAKVAIKPKILSSAIEAINNAVRDQKL